MKKKIILVDDDTTYLEILEFKINTLIKEKSLALNVITEKWYSFKEAEDHILNANEDWKEYSLAVVDIKLPYDKTDSRVRYLGLKLAKLLKERYPDMNYILVSRDYDDVQSLNFELHDFDPDDKNEIKQKPRKALKQAENIIEELLK